MIFLYYKSSFKYLLYNKKLYIPNYKFLSLNRYDHSCYPVIVEEISNDNKKTLISNQYPCLGFLDNKNGFKIFRPAN